MAHWFSVHMGLTDAGGPWYLFWSGFGSDLAYLTVLAYLYRRITCHVDGCVRVGWHHVPGTGYFTCKKHHPTLPTVRISPQLIKNAHAAANGLEPDDPIYGTNSPGARDTANQ